MMNWESCDLRMTYLFYDTHLNILHRRMMKPSFLGHEHKSNQCTAMINGQTLLYIILLTDMSTGAFT
jgi:hypothetical protein